ncbi:MAG: hypothetical protein QOI74_678, partial [Micromonosporaceae bacterium]|nr:hypothetical protein [Micromonosporaceae bacterium]
MSDVATQEEWAADRMYGTDPAPCHAEHRPDTGDPDEPVNLDTDADPEAAAEPDPNAGAHRTAVWLGGAVV